MADAQDRPDLRLCPPPENNAAISSSGADEKISAGDIKRRIRKWSDRIVELEKDLDQAKRRRNGLIETLAEYEVSTGDAPAPAEDVEAIQGKPVRRALVILAERHDKILESRVARKALEAAGQHISPNRLWKEIAILRRFKKIGHGVYRLLPAVPETGTLF